MPFNVAASGLLVTIILAATTICIAIIVAVRWSRKSRIDFRGKQVWLWRSTIAILCLPIVFFFLNGTIKGGFEAVAAFVGFAGGSIAFAEYFGLTHRPLRVVVVGKVENRFTKQIAEGVGDRLRQAGKYDIRVIYSEKSMSETAEGVVRRINEGALDDADAVILIPGEVNEDLRRKMVQLIKRGVYLVLCDVSVPRDYFLEKGVVPPVFIGTDFPAGGSIVAGEILNRAREGDLIAVVCGPDFNEPAYERAREVLYQVHKQFDSDRIFTIEIENWSKEHIVERVQNRMIEIIRNRLEEDGIIHIYSGNDENAIHIDSTLHLVSELPPDRTQIYGFDGVEDANGDLRVRFCSRVVFTVDTDPKLIGAEAAGFVRAAGLSKGNEGLPLHNRIIPRGVSVDA